MSETISQEELVRWIAWSLTPSITSTHLRQTFDDGHDGFVLPTPITQIQQAEAIIHDCLARDIEIVTPGDARYPVLLNRRTPSRGPFFLTGHGEWGLLREPVLVLCGSQWITDTAESATRTLISAFAARGLRTIATFPDQGICSVARVEAGEGGLSLATLARAPFSDAWPAAQETDDEEMDEGKSPPTSLILYTSLPWENRLMDKAQFCRLVAVLAGAIVLVAPQADELSGHLASLALRMGVPCHIVQHPLLSNEYPATDSLIMQGATALTVNEYFIPEDELLEALLRETGPAQKLGVIGEQLELF